MKGLELAIAFDPEYVRRSALVASFEYPAVADQELLRGWAKVPVWPRLWEYAIPKTGKSEFPSPDDMVEFLLDLADEGDSGIKHRAQKLVMDFIREVHAYALLFDSGRFYYVTYQRVMDLQYNIDFEVLPKELESPVGIQTAMRRIWKADTWRQIHEERRRRRGAKNWEGPIFWMTNRRIEAEELPNKLWLFKTHHVQEVILEIKGQIKEFNTRFLLATQPYMPKVALARLRECREDIKMFGWEYAQRKWAKFVGGDT
ncbi:hypothetical protein ES708_34993 [subsurface metagenome]